jgi:enoyl-[acyl-carrier protein] reductase / trans-2-enoyl-CoA reductase (NAD+)
LVTEENLFDLTDFAGYKAEFLRLFGFGINGVDYDAETSPQVQTNF